MKKKLRKKYYYADGRNEPYSHDTIICPSKSLQFYYKRPTSKYDKELEDDHNEVQPHQASDCFNGDPKLKDDQSQNQNQNKNQPHEADHFDDISKSDCLIFQPLLVVQKENEKEDGFSANILHDQNFCEERLCTQITIVDSSLNMASKELDKKLELKERYPSLYQPINDVGKHDSKGKGQDTLPQHLWPMQPSSDASTFDADEIWEKDNYKVEELEAYLLQLKLKTNPHNQTNYKFLLDKLKLCKGVSYAAVAAHADKNGRRKLAAMLVEHEPRSSKQVPLLLSK
ncbi:hypothetical protein F0562_018043 [Nyssa sinensis]|uniref:Vps16 C-terminal domain-containing protein n=1 Tax=Nyssa sinensis TaxID=561372 RepID=A0A5J4ZAY9_9ASTE|nr:hypothetical protein F0562_018043 [Nyssa sinensis]